MHLKWPKASIMSCFYSLFFILCGAVGSSAFCSNASVCVANHKNDTWCKNNGFAEVVTELSELMPECKSVRIYLTSGTHTLSAKLTFKDSVKDTEIYGSPTGEPSIIQCKDEAGIRFNRSMMSNIVLIKDITFVHCACESKYQAGIKTTLFIELTSSVILENVAVHDSAGYGILTHDCSKHVIKKLLFSQ